MVKMKKSYWGKSFRIVLMACLLLMVMMQAVSAEKVEYKDKNYNFKAIKNVLLYDMDFSDTNIEGVRERSLGGMYEEKAMQEKIPVITPEAVIRKMSLAQGQDLEILAQKDSEAFNDIFDKNISAYPVAPFFERSVQIHADLLAICNRGTSGARCC